MSSLADNDNHDQPEDDDVFVPTPHPDGAFCLVHGDASAEQHWILIGTADAAAAAACQPADVAVHCLDHRSLAAPDGLDVVEGKTVVIFPHGDAAKDFAVYEQLSDLGAQCEAEGAKRVQFVSMRTTLASHLENRDAARCAERLTRLATSQTAAKPAKLRPKAPSASQLDKAVKLAAFEQAAQEENRVVVNINDDRRDVLDALVAALQTGNHRDALYDLGGKLAFANRSSGGAVETELVEEELLLNLLADSAKMVAVTERSANAAWPESKTIAALFGRRRNFRQLRGVAPAPIVRADNTIACADGYDEASKVLLDLAGLDIDIPDAPSDDDVEEAVDLLMNDWLADFPFTSDADRANAMGLLMTYPLRELVSAVPLAVISAKSQGTGKSKLLGLVVRLFTGAAPEMDSLPDTEEETRKQITTLLSKSAPFLCFDESPRVGGKSLNRLLTSQTWSDRLLGGNERVALPNRSVMAATGNNVQVQGDTRRRYYPIDLNYLGENPENRPASDFKHHDVEAWTDANRGELLTAVFTLIRAWQTAGSPRRAASFGSFEQWEGVVGGLLDHVSITGFLSNLKEHRRTVDYDEALWVGHCEWLSYTFPSLRFTSREVVAAMTFPSSGKTVVDPAAALPPEIDLPPTDVGYSTRLGKLYTSRDGGTSGGYRISRTDDKIGNATRWSLTVSEEILQARAAEAAAMKAARSKETADRAAASAAATTVTATSGPGTPETVEEIMAKLQALEAAQAAANPALQGNAA